MNAIGIDHQRTLTLVTVAEGTGDRVSLHSVTDGARAAIPNASSVAAGTWASATLAMQGEPPLEALCLPTWRDAADGVYFCHRLADRIADHLGRADLSPDSGYALILVTQGSDDQAADESSSCALAEKTGLPILERISAPDALLAAFLAGSGLAGELTGAIVAVAVGDTTTTVRAYAFARSHLKRTGSLTRMEGTGHAYWATRLVRMVQERLPEPIALDAAPVVRDAVIEYAKALSAAARDQAVSWKGPFAPSMYTQLKLTPRACAAWIEARQLMTHLRTMIERALAAVDGGPAPVHIILGGIGTVWPFIEAEVASIAPVWPGGPAPRLIAEGAALWKTVRLGTQQDTDCSPDLNRDRLPGLPSPSCDGRALPSAIPSQAGLLPPWQRPRNLLDDED